MSHQSSKSLSSPPSPHHALPYTRRSSVSIPSLPQNPPQRRSRSFRESRNNVRSTRYPSQLELEGPGLSKPQKTIRNRPPPLNCFSNTSSSNTTERSSVSSASTATTFFNTSTESSGSTRTYNRKNNSTPNSASNWSVSSEYSTTSSVNKRVNAAGGKLAYLASRRGSIGSVCSSGCSTPPNTPGLGGTARGRRQSSGNFLEVPNTTSYTSTELSSEPSVMSSPLSRPRVNSLPATSIVSPQLLSPTYVPYSTLYNPRSTMTKSQDYLYRLRSFNITKGGGVVNCGDTIVRRSKSNNCINEDDFGRKASITYSPTRSPTKSQRSSPGRRGSLSPRLVVVTPLLDTGCCVATSQDYNDEEYEDELTMREFGFEDIKVKYRVVLLGESGVGKSALVRQFMTSEYINTYDMSLGGLYLHWGHFFYFP
ncbi:unnamed protein product [Orchesella dallaii]|uniref:Uncharacterized protein n=1 Tax=Orchesella dallaii TaxID=48710 RepID=A0ABP1PL58_9HEXA